MSYQYNNMNGQTPAGQGFAAHPRVVPQKQKFKDPYSSF